MLKKCPGRQEAPIYNFKLKAIIHGFSWKFNLLNMQMNQSLQDLPGWVLQKHSYARGFAKC
jgi:hypothetical protein